MDKIYPGVFLLNNSGLPGPLVKAQNTHLTVLLWILVSVQKNKVTFDMIAAEIAVYRDSLSL